MPQEQIPRVGGYEIIEFIARGGTAEVWRARDPAGRQVAVKLLDRDAGLSSRTEWQALKRFRFEEVVEVVDLARDDTGRSALILEYCDGGTLESTVRGRGGLTVGETAAAIRPMAGVVGRLHAQGVVHGDLHPRNVLFTGEGAPKLADLGCLRSTADLAPSLWCSDGFTAPEILDGGPTRPASDAYSLGALTWFCLLGEAPPPPALRPFLRDVLPDVPQALCEAVAATLSLTPSARPDAQDLADALARAAEPVPVPVAAHPSEEPGVMTRRRRQDAVQRQVVTMRRGAGGQAGSHPHRRAWIGAGLVGGAAVVAAALAPAPVRSNTEKSASPTSISTVSSSATTASPGAGTGGPTPRRTVAPVHFPDRTEVEGLLRCRARAWNSGSLTSLTNCLAEKSQALVDDTKRLKEASAQGLRFAEVDYSLEAVHRISLEAGRPTARVVVRQRPYTVRGRGQLRTVPAEVHRVRLTFTGGPKAWKLASWNTL